MIENFTVNKLLQYNWRIKIFIRKYERGEAFEFMSGPKKSFVYSMQVAKLIEEKNAAKLEGPILLGKNKQIYQIKDLELTDEFKENFEGYKAETKEIKQTQEELISIKGKILSATVPIKAGNGMYQVSAIAKTPGTMKSDFNFVDIKDNPILWISHKDGKKPTDFQQWSGMTESGIKEDPEVQDFFKAVRAMFPLGMDRATTVARQIHNNTLKKKAVYGINYGGSYGPQNVTMVAQGNIDIKKDGMYYAIQANHILYNGDDITEDYLPVLSATYRGDRSQEGVKGARFTIQPIASRKINAWI